ncbi:hypothetical protein NUW54_g8318 [Trametes sanguinea]|uniref:Uncharacterized protein n=1 Tax=Trametes sanguinea TaxID=158606 RepID=A0ACC1PG62_9APHY|nr:hypothetical protein NUW54_g8318 [Trametes sanguinea]
MKNPYLPIQRRRLPVSLSPITAEASFARSSGQSPTPVHYSSLLPLPHIRHLTEKATSLLSQVSPVSANPPTPGLLVVTNASEPESPHDGVQPLADSATPPPLATSVPSAPVTLTPSNSKDHARYAERRTRPLSPNGRPLSFTRIPAYGSVHPLKSHYRTTPRQLSSRRCLLSTRNDDKTGYDDCSNDDADTIRCDGLDSMYGTFVEWTHAM